MVLLEEYYELNESPSVSKFWKYAHIFLYLLVAATGIGCSSVLLPIINVFENKCYLYGSVFLTRKPNSDVYHFDPTKSEWHGASICDYCTYSMSFCFLVAAIWVTFFIMCGRGGKAEHGLPQPWRIVMPALLFAVVYMVIALEAAYFISVGTKEFCRSFDAARLSTDPPLNTVVGRCGGLDTLLASNSSTSIVTQMSVAEGLSWACGAVWVAIVALLALRIYRVVDFDLYKPSTSSTVAIVETPPHDCSEDQQPLRRDSVGKDTAD